jgi:hypothetical protein
MKKPTKELGELGQIIDSDKVGRLCRAVRYLRLNC